MSEDEERKALEDKEKKEAEIEEDNKSSKEGEDPKEKKQKKNTSKSKKTKNKGKKLGVDNKKKPKENKELPLSFEASLDPTKENKNKRKASDTNPTADPEPKSPKISSSEVVSVEKLVDAFNKDALIKGTHINDGTPLRSQDRTLKQNRTR